MKTRAMHVSVTRRTFVSAGAFGLVAMALNARGQSPGALPRVGYLNNLNPTLAAPSTEAFLQGMRDAGWIEGKNFTMVYRWADGNLARHPALVTELVNLPVDVIVTAGTTAVKAAHQATRTIPVVVTVMPDPVGLGVAASLARPGGNVTGIANLFEELTPKQMQILSELIPTARRVALLADASLGDRGITSATQSAARQLKLTSRVFEIRDPEAIEGAMREAKADRADAVLILPSPFFNRNRLRIAEAALAHKLPTVSEGGEYVRDGGLLSYGPNFPQLYYRAAAYVDRILKGEKAGNLAIERPTKFELVINVKTAKALGISVPQSLLLRADQVVQ